MYQVNIASLLLFLSTFAASAQYQSGYYMDWNVDHTERVVKPAIPISKEEAQTIRCYYVAFDKENKLASVRYFFNGKPSKFSNFGSHQIVWTYSADRYTEKFKNIEVQWTANSSATFKRVYYLNKKGYWTKREYFDKKGEKIAVRGVAVSKLTLETQYR